MEGALAEVLGTGGGSGSGVAADEPLMSAGLDSLGAVEYVNLVSRRLGGVPLPATLIFDYPTPAAITQYLAARLLVPPPPQQQRQQQGSAPAAVALRAVAAAEELTEGASFMEQMMMAGTEAEGGSMLLAAPAAPGAGAAGPALCVVGILSLDVRPLLAAAAAGRSGDGRALAAPNGLPLQDGIQTVPLARWDRAGAASSSADDAAQKQLPMQFGAFMQVGVFEWEPWRCLQPPRRTRHGIAAFPCPRWCTAT